MEKLYFDRRKSHKQIEDNKYSSHLENHSQIWEEVEYSKSRQVGY